MSSRLRSRLALIAAALMLAANVVVPLVWGDVYPFTSAPMFRDSPCQCCNYEVLNAAGEPLPANEWLVQRVYDGNPIGYGVGVRPPAVIEQEFGVLHEEAAVRQHLERQLATGSGSPSSIDPSSIDIVQQIIGPIDSQHVGVIRTQQWRIDRP